MKLRTYDGWKIERNVKPIPDRNHDYDFFHDDVDVGNNLHGTAKNVEDALMQIQEIEEENEHIRSALNEEGYRKYSA
jgi:hypothetical protein